MNVVTTDIPGVQIIEPNVFRDARGLFWESFSACQFEKMIGVHTCFVQDNHSTSTKGALHGLHYQIRQTQGKLVRVVTGEIFDVAVDLRKSSSTFGRWIGTTLSAENKRQMWIPEGFAHGFLVQSNVAEILYKVTDYYAPEHERALLWNDPAVDIAWPINSVPLLSAKDQAAKLLINAEVFE